MDAVSSADTMAELFSRERKAALTGEAILKVRHIENLIHLGEESTSIQARYGLTRFELSHLLRISRKLTEPVKDLLARSRLTVSHARALTSLPAAKQENVAREAIAKKWSAKRLEAEVKAILEAKPANQDASYYENLGEKISTMIGHPVKVIPSRNDPSTGTIEIKYLGYDAFDGIMARMKVKLEEDY